MQLEVENNDASELLYQSKSSVEAILSRPRARGKGRALRILERHYDDVFVKRRRDKIGGLALHFVRAVVRTYGAVRPCPCPTIEVLDQGNAIICRSERMEGLELHPDRKGKEFC